ncbi:MAG TPA: ABC transporter substrate binding protein [Geobacteraceae bacterium]|nr:ABC transporter substrate binding protein [Geobacteraceae bacterium]
MKPFDEALRGFRSVCKADSKTVVVAGAEGVDVSRTIRDERPALILAIGADALQRLKKIRDIPIIYAMVLNPEKIAGRGDNIAGVNMNLSPGKYLGLMEKLNLPNLRVGILYDPAQTGNMLENIRQTALAKGIEITAKEVHNPKEVPELLMGMKGAFNLFWMIPDPTVVTPETVEFLLLFTLQSGVPVVTFAGKYVDEGALFSLDISSFDLGMQAGEMANMVLDGTRVSELPETEARKAILRINRKVAQKLGIKLDVIAPINQTESGATYKPAIIQTGVRLRKGWVPQYLRGYPP